MSNITSKIAGEAGTTSFRVYFLNGDAVISPFHDVPLWVNKQQGIANMLVEIPRGTNAKMEISTKELMNPIKQDVKDGKLRNVHDKYPFNYGALPQTWENPNHFDERTQAKGDNDPIDACEIGSALGAQGEFKQVKVLGVWAMLDAGETDWKVLVIDVKDPLADQINTIEDVERLIPGKINEVFTFLRDYKIPDGKGPNKFAFDSKLLDKEFAIKVTEETHEEWKQLVSGQTESPLAIESTLTQGVKKTVCGKETKAKLSL